MPAIPSWKVFTFRLYLAPVLLALVALCFTQVYDRIVPDDIGATLRLFIAGLFAVLFLWLFFQGLLWVTYKPLFGLMRQISPTTTEKQQQYFLWAAIPWCGAAYVALVCLYVLLYGLWPLLLAFGTSVCLLLAGYRFIHTWQRFERIAHTIWSGIIVFAITEATLALGVGNITDGTSSMGLLLGIVLLFICTLSMLSAQYRLRRAVTPGFMPSCTSRNSEN